MNAPDRASQLEWSKALVTEAICGAVSAPLVTVRRQLQWAFRRADELGFTDELGAHLSSLFTSQERLQ